MAAEPALKVPAWADPAALTALLDDLRAADYDVDPSQYVAAHDLALFLASRDGLADPDRLRRLLGPVLCGSPREQEEFPGHFGHWLGGLEATARPADTAWQEQQPELERELTAVERKARWLRTALWAGLLVLPVLGGVAFWWFGARTRADTETILLATKASSINATAIAGLLLAAGGWIPLFLAVPAALLAAWIVWRAWWRRRAEAFLVRRAEAGEPRLDRIAVSAPTSKLFEAPSLLRAAQEMRRRIAVPSADLDALATVEATVRRGGWLVPIFGRRQVPPEYLILVDRANYHDQRARFVDELVDRLEENHVYVERYSFDTDPRTCFPPPEKGTPLTLRELRARHPGHRLLLFTDGAGFFSASQGGLETWTEQFLFWEERALLTLQPAASWGAREQLLAERFAVLPATLESLAGLTRALEHGDPAVMPAETPRSLPEELRRRPLRWLDRTSPEPWRVETVIDELERYLGDAGFYWLAACAVYPGLDWNLTVYLGDELRGGDGERLLDPRRLSAIAQLPWFRHGHLPDWLRLRLLGRLGSGREREVRAVLTALLLTALDESEDGFALEIARRHRRSLARLLGAGLRTLAKRAAPESPLRDHVFQDFMAGRRPGRLMLPLPKALAGLLARPAADLPPVVVRAHFAIRTVLVVTVCAYLVAALSMISVSIANEISDLVRVAWLCGYLALFWGGIVASELSYIWKNGRLFGIGMIALLLIVTFPALAVTDFNTRDGSVILTVACALALALHLMLSVRSWRELPVEMPHARRMRTQKSVLGLGLALWVIGLTARGDFLGSIGKDLVLLLIFAVTLVLGGALVVGGYVESKRWLGTTGLIHFIGSIVNSGVILRTFGATDIVDFLAGGGSGSPEIPLVISLSVLVGVPLATIAAWRQCSTAPYRGPRRWLPRWRRQPDARSAASS